MPRPAFRPVPLEERSPVARFELAGCEFACDWTGCLYWPQEAMLIVSDLHLEKGAALAARGHLIPPYDTRATLTRLERQIAYWQPRIVVSLGDSFHEARSSEHMVDIFRDHLKRLMAGRDWIWIAGNHDPLAPAELGGTSCGEISVGPLTLRHEPRPLSGDVEISGHLHPVARIVRRGKAVRRRCFASDGARLVMPSFGAFAGGLNIREPAFDGLFDRARLRAHMLGRERVYTIAGKFLV